MGNGSYQMESKMYKSLFTYDKINEPLTVQQYQMYCVLSVCVDMPFHCALH